MSDADRIALERWIVQNDAAAFREIVVRHSAMVYATCRRMLGNATEAEDVTQECFETLAQSKNVPGAHLGAWLHRVATNISTKRIRSDNRRREREKRFAAQGETQAQVEWKDIYEHVDEAMGELPDKFRVPILAHFLQDESQVDIAEALDVSPQTVSYRIKRGTELLGRALRRRGIGVATVALAAMLAEDLAAASPIPASLTTSLGKLALAHTAKPASVFYGSTLAKAIGGMIIMKKIGIAVTVMIAALAFWASTREKPVEPDIPTPKASVVMDEEPDVPDLPPAEPEEVMVIATPAGSTITGRVYDAETERGIADVVLRASAPGRNDGGTFSEPTDDSGTYRISGLAANSYDIVRENTPEGYQRPMYSEKHTVSFEPDTAVESVNFPLKKEVPLRGIVVDSEGSAVSRATVMLHGGSSFRVATAIESRDDGRFSFHHLGATDNLNLQARNDSGLVSRYKFFSLPEQGLTNIELIIEAASVAMGDVLDSGGSPVPDVKVVASPNGSERIVSDWTVTDKQGHYILDGLAAGTYFLNLPEWFSDEDHRQSKSARLELAPAEEVSNLILLYEQGNLSISGRVTYADERPIANVQVLCSNNNRRATTDADGYYEIPGLDDGTYAVMVLITRREGPALFLDRQYVPAGSESVDFVVREHVLTAQVLDAQTSRPVTEFEYAIINSWRSTLDSSIAGRFQRVIDAEGRFELALNRPDRYLLAVRAAGYSTAVQPAVLNESHPKQNLIIHLEKGGDLHGIVKGPEGRRIARASVYYGPPNTNFSPTVMTSSAGTFTLESFPNKAQLISISHSSHAVSYVEIPADVDLSNPLVITLEHGGAIHGSVTLPDSISPRNCRVYVRYPQTDVVLHHRSLGGGNSFKFSHLPSGEATVSLEISHDHKRFSRSLRQIVTVRNNEVSEIEFNVFEATGVLEGYLLLDDLKDMHHARLSLNVESLQGEETFTTGAGIDGSYRIENIPAGNGTLEILLTKESTREFIEGSLPVEIGEGEFMMLDIDMTDMMR